MLRIRLVVTACALVIALPVLGQVQTATLRTVPPTDPVLTPFNIPIELDHTVVFGLTGWSFALCHDATILEVIQIEEGPVLQTANGGDPVDFVSTTLVPGEGWTSGMLVDFFGANRLNPGDNLHIYTATYAPTSLGSTTPCFCEGIGEIPVTTWMLSGDAYYYPSYECPTIAIDGMGPVFLFRAGASASTYEFFGGHGVVCQQVSIEELETTPSPTPVSGFLMTLHHDEQLLTVLGAEPTPELVALNGGTEPVFWSVDLLTDGISIATELSTTGTTIEFIDSTPVALVEYETVAAAVQSQLATFESTLYWDDPSGSDNAVTTPSGDVTPAFFDGTVTLTPVFHRFRRGDCNGDATLNIGDVIHVLNAVFGIGTVPCLEACRTNADLFLDLADGIYLASYLFLQGPPPPSPFPNCGSVAGQDCAIADACP